MNEQTLYTSLLKGVIIGKLSYANSLATYYSKWLGGKEINSYLKPKIIDQLKAFYGSIMEPEDELEMEDLFNQSDKNNLIAFLENLEENYNPYFLSLIAKRRNKVDTIYIDVFDRTKLVIEDDDIHEIKLAESNKNALLAGTIWKKIIENERDTITYFYKQTFKKVNHLVVGNSRSQDEANLVWVKAMIVLLNKLEKMPEVEGYYEWRPISTNEHEKASIFTYFIEICKYRWLDILRKKGKEIHFEEGIMYDEVEIKEAIQEEETDLRPSFKILKAIQQLPESCQKVIIGKYFGGTEGIGITSKELSLESGLAVGYINNIHQSCLDKLRNILTTSKL